ncbi:UDP-N-acetylmuramoyl-tripeptide--D-alanyl-D-alanine ligase [Miniphocaeibacter halophilus]|uniref:UDP-N-acetylmuramoyl-tripeptide--D-alanyl-D-alanine ligase n=1 Tax=Miniphocaeibacter halophilus TaxID=2931922 RepID=A0AC61MSE4_9FIRM|nr:UDP-N-acetylmuramoyl-tripeptide--D-alanyl-D-alanine ligase [Miniphocaeibacter halophilus]QQK08559.1 UDP-N-acetylmuramoyl-tripeptide--D-alanyl-D-alanine ligase [Miniphocaeibacter halophilus]
MIEKNLIDIANMCSGKIYNVAHNEIPIKGISTDSRTVERGNLFIPLVGDNFDGHEYALSAIEKGASAILWEKKRFLPDNNIPVVLVDDTYKAMIELAKNYRLSLDCKVIAITGSNGKTTTKDILSSILKEKFKVQKTQKNFNNEIGLPKTILALDEDAEVAVLELGTEDFGEISFLTDICKPDIALITNIGDSHLLKLKTRENIARAKLEILEGLKADGIFFYNGDDVTLKEVVKEFILPERTFTYGLNQDNDYVIEPLSYDGSGVTFSLEDHLYTVPLLGNHQVYNGGISIIISEFFGLDYSTIAKGLKDINLTGMRNELIHLPGFDILNDSYKSNPQSLDSCLDIVYTLKNYDRKIAVIGDMLDLGKNEVVIHEKIGEEINPDKIDFLFVVGDLAYNIFKKAKDNFPEDHAFHFDSRDELIKTLTKYIIPNTLVMVKASRGMRLEYIVESLKEYSKL